MILQNNCLKENVLIFDDLFDSGATLTAVCNEFKKELKIC